MGKNRDFSKFPNAITVLDNGDVGIGNSNPSTTLHISTANGIRLQYPGNTGYTQFSTDGTNAYIFSGYDGERMRITSAGWVGIGTTSPSNYGHGGTNNILEVQNSGTTANSQSHIIISSGATSNTGALGSITFALPNSSAANKRAAIIYSDITANSSSAVYANLIFGTSDGSGATERMRISPIGNVGIRNSSAYSPLTVTGTNTSWGETITIYPAPNGYTTLAFRLEGADSTTGTWAIGKQSTQDAGGIQYLQIAKNGLTGSSLHRADAAQVWDPSNGNSYFGYKVGIGTTTANGNLQFSNNTNTRKIVLYQGGNNDYEFYGFGVESSRLIYSTYTSGDDHVFVSGASGTARNELMRIKGNGQILTPNQPSFLAHNNSGFTVTGGGWYNISNAILNESYDIGSCYNSSNGRFTAPVAGKYLFYAGGWAVIGSSGERYAFCARVNGGALFFIGGGNYCSVDSPLSGYSIVHNLAANDYVDLWLFSAVTGTWGGGSHGAYWGGYLL